MRDKINRKYGGEDNDMLTREEELIEKAEQILIKKYGYSENQFGYGTTIYTDETPTQNDIIVQDSEDLNQVLIIGEIKTGNFVFPLFEYQLQQYMQKHNAKYGFLYNGHEWINFELIDGNLIRINDIPTASEIKKIRLGEKIKKTQAPLKDPEYKLSRIINILRDHVSSDIGSEIFLQLLACKIFDEKKNNVYFTRIREEQKEGPFYELWERTRSEFPNIFHINYLKDNYLSIEFQKLLFYELADFSLLKSDGIKISQILLKNYLSSRKDFARVPEELIEFMLDLVQVKQHERILVPYTGPEIFLYLFTIPQNQKSYEPDNSENIPELIGFEPNQYIVEIWKLISFLNVPQFQIHNTNPVTSNIYSDFRNVDFVLTIPPFGVQIESEELEDELGDFGKALINYFVMRLITSFKPGAKIVITVPNSFLFALSKPSKLIRNEILKHCFVKSIIQLPISTFQPYTSISSAILILEIKDKNQSEEKPYKIFMSEIPFISNRKQKFDPETLKEITKEYSSFLKNDSIKNPRSIAFTILSSEIIDGIWTVSEKIPEIKIFSETPYKTKIGEIAEILYGKSIPESDQGEEIEYVRISDLKNGLINPTVGKKIRILKNIIPNYSKHILKLGDVLVSCSGTIGKVAIVTSESKKMIPGPQILILRANRNKVLSEYLSQTLSTQLVKQQLMRLAKGVSIPRLSLKDLSDLIISVPPLHEQKKRVQRFLEIEKEIIRLSRELEERKALLGKLGME